uniref:Uncharacterized protein n=1 Tax=Globisporangium ultimum (strain ATCC 200006 / CBS 805.95 / DAOM BR144) TaxID=431595 RepID=K3WNT3_GLOUD
MKALTSLQSEIYDLQVVRNTRRQCVLQTRQAYSGSLLKLVREYYGLFYIGVPDLLVGERRLGTNGYQDLITRQRLYLEHAFDPDFRLGSQPGSVALVLEQWKRYTQYHNDLSARANEFEICGSDEQPIIIARGTVRVRYTHRTFEHVFPHALYDASLVQRFIGKEVVYTYRNVYEFSDDGRIISYEPEIDFVQPLLDAGSSLEDVSRLMQQARIADQCIFFGPDDENESEAAVSMIDEILEDGNISDRTSDSTHSSPAEKMPRTSSKHDMNFLLSQNGGGDDGNSNG